MTPEQAIQVLQRQAMRASGTFDEQRLWESERGQAIQALWKLVNAQEKQQPEPAVRKPRK
jgi:hypothetical protein